MKPQCNATVSPSVLRPGTISGRTVQGGLKWGGFFEAGATVPTKLGIWGYHGDVVGDIWWNFWSYRI